MAAAVGFAPDGSRRLARVPHAARLLQRGIDHRVLGGPARTPRRRQAHLDLGRPAIAPLESDEGVDRLPAPLARCRAAPRLRTRPQPGRARSGATSSRASSPTCVPTRSRRLPGSPSRARTHRKRHPPMLRLPAALRPQAMTEVSLYYANLFKSANKPWSQGMGSSGHD